MKNENLVLLFQTPNVGGTVGNRAVWIVDCGKMSYGNNMIQLSEENMLESSEIKDVSTVTWLYGILEPITDMKDGKW